MLIPTFFKAPRSALLFASKASFCNGDEAETDEDGKDDQALGDAASPGAGLGATGDG